MASASRGTTPALWAAETTEPPSPPAERVADARFVVRAPEGCG
jgi:hypothetical protein